MEFDAIIAGGGPAGCATAAALDQLGLKVLLVDALVDRSKQLAGELLHPSCVQDLESLGFGSIFTAAEAQPIRGFATVDHRPGHDVVCRLPYGDGDFGFALEHATFVRLLMKSLEDRLSPNLTVWRDARILRIVRNDNSGAQVEVQRRGPGEQPILFNTRCLVASDGRASPLRRMLGIEERRERISAMLGVTIDSSYLPHPGHGHLFMGQPSPVLGYAIAPGKARIMVDVPSGTGASQLLQTPLVLNNLPSPLRNEILRAVRDDETLMAANETRQPEAITLRSAVLVGDAAGCCHPVSASGMASCTQDAMALQRAFKRFPHSVSGALGAYAQERRAPHRTRIALATALYQAFAESTPEMEALRQGLFRYWQFSAKGRATSMALLSTREARMWIMAIEYARVVLHSLIALFAITPTGFLPRAARTAFGLVYTTVPHLSSAVQGVLEDTTRL